jgi:Ankyrin repeats (many copies)
VWWVCGGCVVWVWYGVVWCGMVGAVFFCNFMKAAHNGHLEIVKVLLDNSASIDKASKYDETSLFIAAKMTFGDCASVCKSSKRDAFQVATELILRGVDLNENCPLNIAIQNRFLFFLFLFFFFFSFSFSFSLFISILFLFLFLLLLLFFLLSFFFFLSFFF